VVDQDDGSRWLIPRPFLPHEQPGQLEVIQPEMSVSSITVGSMATRA
jgi:hypothetical protein